MYPASPDLVPVAKKSFDTAYFGNQDIFAVATKSYEAVNSNWSWGPTMSATDKAVIDRLGRVSAGTGELATALTEVHADTTKAMQARGLTVAN